MQEADSGTGDDEAGGGRDRPIIEVTVRLFGWAPGQSEVELTIPGHSDLGRPEASGTALFSPGLRRRIERELADAMASLTKPPP